MTPDRDSTGRDPNRGTTGRFERTLEGAHRDAEACRMRSRGETYQHISDALGYGDRHNARRAVAKALEAVTLEPADDLKKLQLDRLDYLTTRALKVLERKHLAVTQSGKIVRHKGKPLLDDAPILQAIDRLLRIDERRSRLTGIDAPSRHEVITLDAIDAEIARLSEQLGERADAVTETGTPQEAP